MATRGVITIVRWKDARGKYGFVNVQVKFFPERWKGGFPKGVDGIAKPQ
jgi:hypothetical protein